MECPCEFSETNDLTDWIPSYRRDLPGYVSELKWEIPRGLITELRPCLRQRSLVGRFEFIARLPRRHGIGLRDEPRREQSKLCVLDHAVEIPAVIELVGGLMVLVPFPGFDLLTTPFWRVANDLRALTEGQGRDADPGKRDLVATIEVAAVGKLLGLQRATLRLCDTLCDLIERGLAHSDERSIVRTAEDGTIERPLEIDVGSDSPDWDRRVQRVVLGAQLLDFFGGNEQHQE